MLIRKTYSNFLKGQIIDTDYAVFMAKSVWCGLTFCLLSAFIAAEFQINVFFILYFRKAELFSNQFTNYVNVFKINFNLS